MNNHELNWSDMAFGSKKPLKSLKAIFIAPSRQMSQTRFVQIIKKYLPLGNIVVAISKENYILGYDNQPQFKTLDKSVIEKVITKVNSSTSVHKITILNCSQKDVLDIYNSAKFKSVLLVNGSWQYSFHLRPEYYCLVNNNIPFEYISPFADEAEAISYDKSIGLIDNKINQNLVVSEAEALSVAIAARRDSFDTSFQTGVALAEKVKGGYKIIKTYYNKTVPYRTFAWHYGAQREKHCAMPGDLTYYDTVHAEILMAIDGKNLDDKTLFIELLPCPNCARMLCETGISEIVYSLDHSDGYAVKLLEKAGKTVRRHVVTNDILDMETE